MKIQAIILIVCALLSTVILAIPEQTREAMDISRRVLFEDVDSARFGKIRIAAWNAKRLTSQQMDIEQRDDAWVLPQHYFYPADAGNKVGTLLAALLGLELGQPLKSKADSWSDYRLHDPLADSGDSQKYCGRRISVWAKNGEQLLDVIIGAEVPGSPGYRYLRLLKDRHIYRVQFEPSLPTRFVDWVDTTLLPIVGNDIRSLRMHYYTVDGVKRRIGLGVQLQFARKKLDALWESPNANEGDVVDDATIYRIIRGALESRIYGVRPFHKTLSKMEPFGFYDAQGLGPGAGRGQPIAGSAGRIEFGSNNGLTYYCYLGDVVTDNTGLSGGISGTYRYVMLACGYNFMEDAQYDGKNAKERSAEMRQQAGQFNKRFAKFIYIIDEEDFKQLRPEHMSLYKKPEQEKQP